MAASLGMQRVVNTQPAPAVAGDYCDQNPRSSVNSGPGGFRCGTAGVTIGNFAWAVTAGVDPSQAPTIVNSTGSGPVTGFVHREQQGLITTYLTEYGMVIPAGFGVTLMNSGGFWMHNSGAGPATVGQKAFANTADGSVQFANAGATVAGAVETKWYAASNGLAGELVKTTSISPG